MCLIVDVNVAEAVLLKDNDPVFKFIHEHLFATKAPYARLVYGGKLAEEYKANKDIIRVLLALDRAGRTRVIPGAQIDRECEPLKAFGICRSNDVHILALARAGNVRLLCSHDKALQIDFGEKRILDSPRGKVYTDPSHKHLIVRFCKSCFQP